MHQQDGSWGSQSIPTRDFFSVGGALALEKSFGQKCVVRVRIFLQNTCEDSLSFGGWALMAQLS